MKIYTIRIVYKSGYTIDFECADFSCSTTGGEISKVSWEPVEGGPRPLAIGITDIAAVWEMGVKEA